MALVREAALTFGHVVLALFIVSNIGTSWIIGNTTDTSKENNGTCHMGLWNSNCGKSFVIDTGNNTKGLFYVAQYSYGVSFIISFLTVVLSYFLLCCQSGGCGYCFATVLFALATLANTVALVVVGVNYGAEGTFPADYKYLFLGWTYWVAVASDCMLIPTLMFTAYGIRAERSRTRCYCVMTQYDRL